MKISACFCFVFSDYFMIYINNELTLLLIKCVKIKENKADGGDNMSTQNKNASFGVIIAAAGSGSRMGGVYKPLEKLCNRVMLLYSLDVFEKNDDVAFVVISAREDKIEEIESLCKIHNYKKVISVVKGGKTRQDSVENAFIQKFFEDENIKYVAVHDAARPMITQNIIENVFRDAEKYENAVCASKVRDTVKRTDEQDVITDSVERENLWLIQTPQVFLKENFVLALENAKKTGQNATDESTLLQQLGKKVKLCDTYAYNIKVTYPEDVFLAECIIKNREGEDK